MTDPVDGVSVVVPCFGEEHRLPSTIERLRAELDQVVDGPWEIVVADDGSADGTRRVAEDATLADPRVRLVALPAHLGKGAALRAGTRAATYRSVVFIDADLPVPVRTIGQLQRELGTADVVVGSRRLRNGTVVQAQPLARRVGGRAFLAAISALGLRSTSDPQCGVKAVRRGPATDVVARVAADGFAFDVELIARARGAGLALVELPVEWNHVPGSSIRPVRDALRTLRELLAVRRRVR